MDKILVFGATGEVGEYVTELLSKRMKGKYEIIAVGQRQTKYFDKYGVRYISVDVVGQRGFDQLPKEEVYAVVDFAAILPARMKSYEPKKFLEINTIGTFNVLEYAREVGAKRFIYTKSVADYYGYLTGDDVLNDDMPVKYKYTGDHTIYAVSKCAAADMVEHYHQMYGMKGFIFRLPNIYCYHPEKTYLVNGEEKPISYRYMIDKACKGEDIELWGDPEKGRDVIYVKDFAQIIYKALLADVEGGTYNVGSGVRTSMEDQIKGIIDVFAPEGTNPKIIYCPEKRDCINYLMDISKVKNELGYEPRYDYISYLEDYKKEMISERFEGM